MFRRRISVMGAAALHKTTSGIRHCPKNRRSDKVRLYGPGSVALYRTMTSGRFDIAVCGGGMVGLAFAIAAARSGLSVVVIDAAKPAALTAENFDGRVSAIAPAPRRFLEAIGAWEWMAPHAQAISDIVVSDGTVMDGAAPFFLHFAEEEGDGGPLSHIVENRYTRLGLARAAENLPGLTQISPNRVVQQDVSGGAARLILADGRVLEASVIVGAEGRHSPTRDLMDVRLTQWEYGQHGIVTTVEHELPHQATAQEFFLPSGPFAILPMTGNRASLVWTEKAEAAPHFMALSDDDFADEVRRRFTGYLGHVAPVGPRFSYPLSMQLSSHYVRARRALIGDAAHVVHPIAGQGLNLGLADAAALAEVLGDAMRLGLDIGHESVLERYQTWRRFDAFAMAAVTDVMNRLFSNDIAPLRLLRDAGLALTGRMGAAKSFLVGQASGYGVLGKQALPKLMRG